MYTCLPSPIIDYPADIFRVPHPTYLLQDIITNVAAIGVNQAWAGVPGGIYSLSLSNVTLQHCSPDWDGDRNCTLPVWQAYYKPLEGGAAAVLFANHGDAAVAANVVFKDVPGLACGSDATSCLVTDVWQQTLLGSFATNYSVPALTSHDSLFLVLRPDTAGAARAAGTVIEGET